MSDPSECESTRSPHPTSPGPLATSLLPPRDTIFSFLPTASPQHAHLLQTAHARVTQQGATTVLEELSRAHTTLDAALLPYLAMVAIERLAYPPRIRSLSQTPHSVLRTGCASLDALVGGGFPLDAPAVFEVSGAAGAGKTQLMIQLALMAPAPCTVGGLASSSIYVSTEGKPPISRFHTLSMALPQRLSFACPDPSLAEGVIVEKVRDSDHLLYWASARLPWLLRRTGARVIIVDSVAALYRPEFHDPVARANHLVQLVRALRTAIAPVSGVCICVNQVSQAVDRFSGTLDATVPALGSSWAQLVATRVFLKRTFDKRRVATILHSSYLPNDGRKAYFRVASEGIVSDDDHD